MNSLLIYRNSTALLQSLRDLVNRGYSFWTSGTIKTLKAENLCVKFNERYDVLAPRQKRNYNRKLGRASSYLFIYPQTGGDVMDWILIATKGAGAIHNHESESLRDHTSGQHTDRVRWRYYELITLNGRMTWRLRRDIFDEWEKKVVSAARKQNMDDLEQTIKVLRNFPMFTGVREQVWSIVQKARKTRNRHHFKDELNMSRLPTMRRITVYDAPPKTLGRLVDEYKALISANNFAQEKVTAVDELYDRKVLEEA